MAEVLYLLACYGLTFAVCDAKLFFRPRNWVRSWGGFFRDLLACYFCVGFWTSMLLFVLTSYGTLVDGTTWMKVVWIVAHGFAGAAFSYALNAAVVFMETAVESSNGE